MVTKTFDLTEEQDTTLQNILTARGLDEATVINQQFAFFFKRMIESEWAEVISKVGDTTGMTDSEVVDAYIALL